MPDQRPAIEQVNSAIEQRTTHSAITLMSEPERAVFLAELCDATVLTPRSICEKLGLPYSLFRATLSFDPVFREQVESLVMTRRAEQAFKSMQLDDQLLDRALEASASADKDQIGLAMRIRGELMQGKPVGPQPKRGKAKTDGDDDEPAPGAATLFEGCQGATRIG